jgi:hypothetical protein
MRTSLFIIALLIAAALTGTATIAQQAPAPATAGTTMTVEALAQKIMEAESGVTARMSSYKPLVEVYVQYVEPHAQLGTVPVKDDYFLGQFESSAAGPVINSFTVERSARRMPFASTLRLENFAAMTVPDWKLLNSKRYSFTFLRREFLGEVRCLVLDVAPRVASTDGFTGRIWVEDRDFNIVRFNGIIRGLSGASQSGKKFWFNVDSWRANVKPSLWLPSYVYSEQHSEAGPTLKSQMRLWGYDLRSTKPAQEFTTITIDEPSVRDNTDRVQQLSPTLSQRMWDQQAEENVVERLTKAGLLAPVGEVDKVLETVATNLQITNNLTTMEPVKARVLLTSPLESFTVGRTIVLSRGLIDVLPDEASLAAMLAHEIAHIVLGHRVIDSKFAFADKLMVPDDELLRTVAYRHSQSEEEAADQKVIELLTNSPYKDKLAEAGLFLRALSENSLKLKNLIQPHIGENSSSQGQIQRLTQLIQQSPALSPEKVDQVAALPLGARVVVDPWSGRIELLKGGNVPLASAREKASLAITPLVPYLRYIEAR